MRHLIPAIFLSLFVWVEGSSTGVAVGGAGPLLAAPGEKNHALFTAILKDHVRKGNVRYASLKKDARLGRYIGLLESSRPQGIKGRRAQLAYWINVYNAFTLKLIVDNYPLKSITELHSSSQAGQTIWDKWRFKIDGRSYTLNQVEHKIIRPRFREPRVHAALVCAAVSCPPLRAEAYQGDRLERQLSEQMRIWLKDRSKNYYDTQKNILYLSKIFDWFEEDFVRKGGSITEALLPYLPAPTRKRLQGKRKKAPIRYLKYDWSLNEA